ncbi:MAG TPA: hypothetical protein VER08_08610 [Pyrinomonadaceae bacterium]|nr:hypothetical protein [Pyrinomonadaceae bacterium]
MRLARRALLLALATLTLCAAASAQTLRQENDPRNQAPTVGTGGSPGGPTGLFTIYDGNTLRRGEFTFSFAYSNYDRDPGNVDITEIPVSFQVGINDHLELFYNTDAYRGVKVNNPQNLSSFYLPNSQLFTQARIITPSTNPLGGPSVVTLGPNRLQSGGAIVLAPTRLSGSVLLTNFPTLFRPVGNQTFVPFPFVGGAGPDFGLTGNRIAVPFTSRLGFNAAGGGGNFGAADNFPGIGSPFGSILPGIVLTTRVIPANLTFNTLVVPDLFTVAPVYLPDAPFVNRLYGESTFSTHTFGANIRLTEPDNALSVNIIPMYRWYWDKADDADGFNQLQRGASPGGSLGDFGVFGVVGGRLSRSVHVAANFGTFINSNPRSEAFGGGEAVLLDRPNEFISGVGFDFPVNRHFQPMAELKSVWYYGGRTPNAFPNNPVDFLGGVRVFPRRWFGFSAWYRAHLNQQGERFLFGGDDDFPAGFEESEDPHGFGFQFFIGHRNRRAPDVLPNQPPTVNLTASSTRVVLPADCGPGQRPVESCVPTTGGPSVQLSANATDPDGDTLLYTYSTTGGTIRGDGPNATLDLSGAGPGTYNVTVEVDDGCGCVAFSTVSVTVERCPCEAIPAPPCPTVRVSCPDTGTLGQPVTFTADVSGGDTGVTPTFNWSVSAGTISSGQGTSSITVDTTGVTGTITATVDVGGYPSNCSTSASCTTSFPARPEARKIDEYGPIRFNDEKARLDNLAIALQNDPTAQGYLVCYGGRRGRAGEAQARCDRARNYLVNERGITADRIVTVDGGYREELTVELWVVPTGANPPTATPTVDASEVQTTPAPRRRTRRGRRDDDE